MVEQTQGNSAELKALNTTVMLLSQKMAYLVRNEKILSKNILILNEKINKVAEKSVVAGGSSADSGQLEEINVQVVELYDKQKSIRQEIESLRASMDNLKEVFVTKEELQELKYIIDTINPLEFVTYQQLKDMLNKK
ncbi:MAG: hypothetical protein PHH82_03845 [Candidatus ainarchaeum sp.]|nr:hypothetical protein [Candidatus ainarchaeum sp.]